MINVGIIGLGFMAATHLKAYRQLDGVRVAALCNPSDAISTATFPRWPATWARRTRSSST
jgi:predicted dehydrogenase